MPGRSATIRQQQQDNRIRRRAPSAESQQRARTPGSLNRTEQYSPRRAATCGAWGGDRLAQTGRNTTRPLRWFYSASPADPPGFAADCAPGRADERI